MPTNKVIIFGLNDFAELSHYYFSTDSDYEVVGFTVDRNYLTVESYRNLPVIPFEEITSIFPPSDYLIFIPMSGIKMNTVRKNKYLHAKELGYSFASYVSSKATIFNSSIGENCFILENNTIQPFVTIGNNVVLWSGNHIGHHSTICDHVFFTSHVVLSGHCVVKERSWIGVNATIRDNVIIEEGSLVAMGSTLTKSTEENCFYMGSPAKKQEKKAFDVY